MLLYTSVIVIGTGAFGAAIGSWRHPVQMTTALRPILGTSETLLPKEKKFFAAHWSDVMREPTKAIGVNTR